MEVQLYTGKMAAHLVKYGWVQVAKNADFKVNMMARKNFSTMVDIDVPIYAQTGGGTSYLSGSYSNYVDGNFGTFSGTAYQAPTYGVVGYDSERRRMYSRMLVVSIVDRAGKRWFWGEGHSSGFSSDLFAVAPAMIDSLMEGFPGKNGESYRKRKVTARGLY